MSKRMSAFKAQTHFKEVLDSVWREEERFIEEYSDQRLRSFLAADRFSRNNAKKFKRRLKSSR